MDKQREKGALPNTDLLLQSQQVTTPQPDQPTTEASSSNRIVVFADMLGFAALTEANPIDIQALQAQTSLGSLTFEVIHRWNSNPLSKAFSGFHLCVKSAIQIAEMRHPLTAITFSDSVFVATTYLFQAASFAVYLAQSMISDGIPVRMGIAFGTFAALRFRSDIYPDGGDHAAQFLGTAVVRAYQAEKCGIKGIRILLHPSTASLLSDDAHNPSVSEVGTRLVTPLNCADKERENKDGVRCELNYWTMPITKERKAWQRFQDMWAVVPDSETEHYQATAEAINRMRTAQGEAPLTDLRRRMLPRRRK